MATFNKFDNFTTQLLKKEHNLNTDAITVALTTSAPTSSWSYLSDVTGQITYTGMSSRVLAGVSVTTPSAGVAKFANTPDLVLTSTSAFTFRYVILYNDTPATNSTKGLIGWADYGASITINPGENFTIDTDQTNGILTVGP